MRLLNFLRAIIILSIVLGGCRSSVSADVDLSGVDIDMRLMHFEQDLFGVDPGKLKDTIPFLRSQYGEFFDLFSYKVIRIGSPDNPSYPSYLLSFVTDYNINKVKHVVESTFRDFDTIYGKRLENLFRHFRYYFPKSPVPVVITYISGFNQSMVTTDTILGIALDKYLGGKSPFYGMLGLPRYLRMRMYPEYIPADAAKAWLVTQFPLNDSIANTLLAHVIYEGKLIYSAKRLLPGVADTLIFGLSSQQIQWCQKYEAPMWEYLLDKKLLFSSDFQVIKRFVDEGPFTKDFGQRSPGRAVIWIGYRIVERYMKNSDATLADLMNENDMNKILRISKYKP